jgi:hypothetical protein
VPNSHANPIDDIPILQINGPHMISDPPDLSTFNGGGGGPEKWFPHARAHLTWCLLMISDPPLSNPLTTYPPPSGILPDYLPIPPLSPCAICPPLYSPTCPPYMSSTHTPSPPMYLTLLSPHATYHLPPHVIPRHLHHLSLIPDSSLHVICIHVVHIHSYHLLLDA